MADHSAGAPTLPKKRKIYAPTTKKRESDKARSKTRVNLGLAFPRWRELKERLSLSSDADLGMLLLDRYEGGPSVSTPQKRLSIFKTPLSPIAGGSAGPFREEEPEQAEEGSMSDTEPRPCSSAEEMETVGCLQRSFTELAIEGAQEDVVDSHYNAFMNTVICLTDEELLEDDDEGHDHTHTAVGHTDAEQTLTADEDDPERTLTADERDDALAADDEYGSDADDMSEDYEQVSGEDDSGDEDYVPTLSLRSGGGLHTAQIDLNTLPAIGMDEVVYDPHDLEGPDTEEGSSGEEGDQPEDIVGHPAYIAYQSSLTQLISFLELPIQSCPVKNCQAQPPFVVKFSPRGSAAVISWICSASHIVWSWNSQPKLKFGMQAGDFMMATNILLSGNNFSKVKLLFKHMNMGIVADKTFFKIQNAYCVDAIKEFWDEQRGEVIQRLATKDVVALADGRMDSPGHCAQYCSYTTMDNETKDIIALVTIDKRETERKAVIMEKEAFIRTMDLLLDVDQVNIVEICTDAHVQISALMSKGKYKDLGIFHSLDMWHGAKNLAKRITAVGQQSGMKPLLVWLKAIVNHFWWCCNKASTHNEFMEHWLAILHHVADEHVWVMGKCGHDCPSTHPREWIVRGSKVHDALKSLVTNKRWLNTVYKYLHFRSTSDLESFQNYILMYASKRFSFSPPVYEARTILAALDYNHNKGRPLRVNAAGGTSKCKVFKKRSNRWTLHTMRTEKTYTYIPELQRRILDKRVASKKGLPKITKLRERDPRRLGLLTAVPAPSMEELLQGHVRRGDDQGEPGVTPQSVDEME